MTILGLHRNIGILITVIEEGLNLQKDMRREQNIREIIIHHCLNCIAIHISTFFFIKLVKCSHEKGKSRVQSVKVNNPLNNYLQTSHIIF